MSIARYLWRHRERPRPFTRRWCVVWAKRLLTLVPLLRLMLRQRWLKIRGAGIGQLTVVENCRIEGDARRLSMGEESFVGAGTAIALHDQVKIGRRVVINRDVWIMTASHALNDPGWRSYSRPVVIEDYAWIATGAMLLPGVTIGRGAVVGAGAVVRTSVPANALAIGNPATIKQDSRAADLRYATVQLCAPFEAWLGRTGIPPPD